MGEFMEYRGNRIKIGTCESLYYLRFDQRTLLRPCGDADVITYVDQYRFRFPFPDEDQIEPGDFEDYDRGVEIPGYAVSEGYAAKLETPPVGSIHLVAQRLIVGDGDDPGELQPVVRDGAGEHSFQAQMFRLDVFEAARAGECLLTAASANADRHDFYLELARRMMAGFALNADWAATKVP